YPECEETHEFRVHLNGMKRVEVQNKDGEKVARWQKVAADHFLHAMFYFKLACDIQNDPGTESVVTAPVLVSGATVSKNKQPIAATGSVRDLLSTFGVR